MAAPLEPQLASCDPPSRLEVLVPSPPPQACRINRIVPPVAVRRNPLRVIVISLAPRPRPIEIPDIGSVARRRGSGRRPGFPLRRATLLAPPVSALRSPNGLIG